MGVSSSRIEEDKALQLCRERKKFVRQALDGRCSLAATHVTYIQSLRNTGTALRKFVEPEGPLESSLYTSTNATPEPPTLRETTLSQFSFTTPSFSQHVDAAGAHSPSPSPPTSSRFRANHMKFRGFSSKKVEEKPPAAVTETVVSSSTPQNTTPRSAEWAESSQFDDSPLPPETPPWDFFGLVHPIDHQFSFQEGNGMNQGYENVDDFRRVREEEGIPELEDEEEKASFHNGEGSQDSEDEFDEPSTSNLVRSFKNLNRLHDHNAPSASPTMPLAESAASETEFVNGGKSNSPDLSPIRATSSIAGLPTDAKKTPVKADCIESKVTPKDFLLSIKDIELLFIKASESGKEVPRMLEANKLHFRPIFPAKESGSMASTLLKACFSCGGEDHIQVQEEPAQTDVKYLTWHRTASSRSSSSRNPLGVNSKDDVEDLNGDIFDSIHMISSSHASTLDRLYAWERKLYDEVKDSEMVRREYDSKCRILRQLESKGESSHRIDKTRAVVKDLHSRIRIAIYRIDSISKRIEELRDKELQPQLEELIEGLSRMWKVMFECHKLQFDIISVAYTNGSSKINIKSDSHRQITVHLEDELSSLSSSFTKWISAQKFYLQAIYNWLVKCVSVSQKSSRRKRRLPDPSLKDFVPIYATCGVWLESLKKLPAKELTDSIKVFAAETSRLLPRQEKNQGKSGSDSAVNMLTGLLEKLPAKELTDSIKGFAAETSRLLPRQEKGQGKSGSDSAVNMLTDEASEDWISGFDHFRSSLVGFLGQLYNFAESSVVMYADLKKAIQEAKIKYDDILSRDAKSSNMID